MMRDFTNRRPSLQCPGKDNDFGKIIIRIILQMMAPEMRQAFVFGLTDDYPADIQVKLYAFVKAMICAWAGKAGLSHGDAAIIEDCRKICDVMGWPSERLVQLYSAKTNL